MKKNTTNGYLFVYKHFSVAIVMQLFSNKNKIVKGRKSGENTYDEK